MTKQQDEDTIAATLYRINAYGNNQYLIKKLVCGVEMEDYHITISSSKVSGKPMREQDIWCNCPGFRIQNFAKIDHKHIKVALDFQSRGEPTWAEYRMTGTGAKAVIRFIRDSTEVA